ncbi:MAG TPA: LapA family protein [Rhodothermales bacterium]|nr:LapA family protein [Rhodothermales bacterium]
MRIGLLFAIIIAVLAVIFAIQNPGYTALSLGPYTIRVLTAVALIVAFGVGALVGMLLTLPSSWRHRRRARLLEKQLGEHGPVVERTVVEDPSLSTRGSAL